MDVAIPVLIAVAILLALAWSTFGRRRHAEGGVTRRPPAPGTTSGSAQDAADGPDREAFERETGDRGSR